MHADPNTAAGLWTIGKLLAWTTDHFRRHDVDEPRLAAEILLAHALNCPRIQLYTRYQDVPGGNGLDKYRDLVRQAVRHAPIAYLVGHKEFFSLEFEVTPAVLVPRPETETLVERALKWCATRVEPPRVLDLGTGSGCLIVAMLKNCSGAIGVGSDVSAEALAVATRNADRHGVADRVRFIQADKLALPPEAVPAGGFDVIVSNPPYVADADMGTLARNVRDHEPAIALTCGGDGLGFFRAIAADAPRLLSADGAVLVEIGAGQREEVLAVFTGGAAFAHAGTFRSPSDPHDRVMQFARI